MVTSIICAVFELITLFKTKPKAVVPQTPEKALMGVNRGAETAATVVAAAALVGTLLLSVPVHLRLHHQELILAQDQA